MTLAADRLWSAEQQGWLRALGLTVFATAGPCFFAWVWAASRIWRRRSGGMRFQPCWAFIARKTTLRPGIYAEAYRSATFAQSTVFHHASM